MDIDVAIRVFVNFINNSLMGVRPLLIDRDYTSDESSLNDWLQSNWELLVERKVLKLNEYLEVLGDGADFNGISSRITDPNAVATFKVQLQSRLGADVYDVLNNEMISLDQTTLVAFVGFVNGYYSMESEVKFVLINEGKGNLERVVSIDDVVFQLSKIELK